MKQRKIYQTGHAVAVHNETIGTTYVKMPITIEEIFCFIVFPNIHIKCAKDFCKQLNDEYEKDKTQ